MTGRFLRRTDSNRDPDPEVTFVCNICGTASTSRRSQLHREVPSCPGCHSNVRFRSVIAALSFFYNGESRVLGAFPVRPEIVGLGTSDWEGYAAVLKQVFAYDNTYYDEHIRLDVAAPVPHALIESCDFIVSSDVLEHVAPPYHRALENMRKMLKPGGLLVLSVPMRSGGDTEEHYPLLHDFKVVELGQERVLVNRTQEGELEVFGDLVFHGGPGVTLEMRMISLPDILHRLEEAGFVNIRPFNQTVPEHGIVWIEEFTWPLVAQVPS